ncbi:SDR family NAD(P)-dependent oxidoreductase [Comamonadaceae bacterium M7527]|nr:SDR family NAD(P)-dependent oxidoreductase [Comamonadaceae bacterium M7527]
MTSTAPNPCTLVSPPNTKALRLVVGAGGGLGQAWLQLLQDQDANNPNAAQTPSQSVGLGRSTAPVIDYTQPNTIGQAAVWLQQHMASTGAQLRQVVVATGYLHSELGQPERSLRHLNAHYLQHVMQVNAIGPALLLGALAPLLPRQGRVVLVAVSAKVGSIGDNALGGWYGYRASKAALNQFVKTTSIELHRHNKEAICVALHPGTVDTGLSAPFAKTGLQVRPASVAASELQAVVDGLTAADSGGFFDYKGQALPW